MGVGAAWAGSGRAAVRTRANTGTASAHSRPVNRSIVPPVDESRSHHHRSPGGCARAADEFLRQERAEARRLAAARCALLAARLTRLGRAQSTGGFCALVSRSPIGSDPGRETVMFSMADA